MSRLKFSLALALALGAALPALAQDTAAPAAGTPAPAAPATGAPAADQTLSMGTDANAPQDGPGSMYVKETFGDWQMRCIRVAEGSEPCDLYQLLKDKDGVAVAEMSLMPLPAGGQATAGSTIVTPLETLLPSGVAFAVDGGQNKRYPFTFCAAMGCVARVGFTADEIANLKKGSKATLTVVPVAAPNETVDLNVSLTGFTAGYDAVAATVPKK